MSGYVPVKLAYISCDPAGGADKTLSPIIFLHGSTVSKESWCDVPQIIANKTKRKVYAVDARNHGDSEWSDDFNFDINADDLLHFMDSISVPKAVLIGHSMGGVTSIRAALKSPGKVEMVFVEDMFVRNLKKEFLSVMSQYVSAMQEAVENLPPETSEEDAPRKVLKHVAENLPDIAKQLINQDTNQSILKIKWPLKRDANGRYAWKTNMAVLAKAVNEAETVMTQPKGLYEGPSYFIYGTNSHFKVNEDEENIKKFFPNAELIAVENADHSIHIEMPEHFTDIVVKKILKQ